MQIWQYFFRSHSVAHPYSILHIHKMFWFSLSLSLLDFKCKIKRFYYFADWHWLFGKLHPFLIKWIFESVNRWINLWCNVCLFIALNCMLQTRGKKNKELNVCRSFSLSKFLKRKNRAFCFIGSLWKDWYGCKMQESVCLKSESCTAIFYAMIFAIY